MTGMQTICSPVKQGTHHKEVLLTYRKNPFQRLLMMIEGVLGAARCRNINSGMTEIQNHVTETCSKNATRWNLYMSRAGVVSYKK